MAEGMSVVVNVMLSLMNVMSPPSALCPSERLDAPSICFVCVLYVGSYLLI